MKFAAPSNRSLSLTFLFALLAPLILFFSLGSLTPGLVAAGAQRLQSQIEGWQPYTNRAAGYAIALPPNAEVTESDDAALAYKMLYVRLPVENSPHYQGLSILVLESADTPEAYVTQAYADAGLDLRTAIRPTAPRQINGRAALRLERDPVVGDGDKFTTLIAGDGVLYRLNLFGGGKGGAGRTSAASSRTL
jgi:hypothetical protein